MTAYPEECLKMQPATEESRATRLTREDAVARLVEAATLILAEKGPSAVKARSVAAAARVSTTSVYYHVGGIPELLQAVADNGFRNLDRSFEAVMHCEDPVAVLFAMAVATRTAAQANPHLYDLMFGLSTRGSYRPAGTARTSGRSEAFQSVYNHLVQQCSALLVSGRVETDENSEIIASQLWSCVHGFVNLELGGHFALIPDPLRQILLPMTVKIFVALGDSYERAYASEASVLDQ